MVWVLMTKLRGDCASDHGAIKVQTKEPVPTIRTIPVMPRPLRKAAPLGLVLDAASPTPLHRQIGEQVRRAILERRLAPGQRLPSSRLMASELDVARGTVLLAMDQLIAEGYLVAQAASGLSVANDLPDDMLTAPRGAPAGAAAADRPAAASLSRRARAVQREATPIFGFDEVPLAF